VERIAEAAKNETCIDCALHQSEKESWRLERHRMHTRIGDLEARLTMVSQVVNQLHAKVMELTGANHVPG
jgi:hypothetical protein